MVDSGIIEESAAYYESPHEPPLIANTIARKRVCTRNERGYCPMYRRVNTALPVSNRLRTAAETVYGGIR